MARDDSDVEREARRRGVSRGAQKLCDWLERNGLTAGDLAGRTGLSRAAVYRWKEGQMPDARNAVLLELATSYRDEMGDVLTDPVLASDWVHPTNGDQVQKLRGALERVTCRSRIDWHHQLLLEWIRHRDEYLADRDSSEPDSEEYRNAQSALEPVERSVYKHVAAIEALLMYLWGRGPYPE